MPAGLIVAILVVVLVVAAIAVLPALLRTRRLHARFGPEYDRVVGNADNRRAAERDLVERERRHSAYSLRSLSASVRNEYLARWSAIQERFVDEPYAAVADADRMVADVMADLGYPSKDFDQRADDLSVRHGHEVTRYRTAHELVVGPAYADTDDLRKALLDYREIIRLLLGGRDSLRTTADSGQVARS
jgi:hypothetical protein